MTGKHTTWHTTRTAAEHAHAHIREIQRAIANGDLPGERRGEHGHWRIEERLLDMWIRGEKPGQRITTGKHRKTA